MSETSVKSSADLPGTWVIVAIGDVAILSPKSNVEDVGNEDLVHFIPMAAVKENFLGIDISQLRLFGEVRKGYTSFSEGDVLFAKITPCMENGKGGLVPHLPHVHAYGSTEFHVLTPTQALLPRWLAYYLSQPSFRKVARHNMTGTAGQMRVPSSWLGAVGIPVAPIPEQTRIVEKLEELLSDLDAGVAELKAAQKKLGQYRQSLLKAAVEGALTAQWRAAQKVGAGDAVPETGAQLLARILQERRARWEARQLAKFESQGKVPPKDWQKKYPEPVQPDTTGLPELPQGWVWATTGLVAESIVPNRDKPLTFTGDIPWITTPDFEQAELHLHRSISGLGLSADECAMYRARVVPSQGVIMTCVGRFGLSAVLEVGAVINQQLHAFIPEAGTRSEYLAYVIQAQRNWLERNATSTTIAYLNKEKCESLLVPLPPTNEQDAILNLLKLQLDSIAEQLRNVDGSLKQSAAQRKNILKAAFSGQLVPQDPNDEPASVLLERIRAERAQRDAVKKPRGRKVKEVA